MQEAIDGYCQSVPGGVTRVVIAHRLSTIRNADVIVVVKDGTVVDCSRCRSKIESSATARTGHHG